MKLPSRKFSLVQIGSAVVPRMNAETNLTYVARDSFEPMHSGANFDYYMGRRAPINTGTFQHSGIYVGCGESCSCAYVVQEIDMIQSAKGTWVPMLFYTDASRCSNLPGKCYTKPDCGLYLWAYGRINTVNNPSSIDNYMSPHGVEVSFDGTLLTPLIEAKWSRWRYGFSPATLNQVAPIGYDGVPPFAGPSSGGTIINSRYVPITDALIEEQLAEEPEDWYIPCGITDICDPERFWVRNLYNHPIDHEGEMDTSKWEHEWIMLQGASSNIFTVYGNTAPRTRFAMWGGTTLTIKNMFGTFTYSYGRPDGSWLYGDTWAGIVMEKDRDWDVAPAMIAGSVPVLEFGQNVVSIDSGVCYIGADNCWIN